MAFSPRFFEFEGKDRLLVVNQTLFKNLPIRAAAVRETGFAAMAQSTTGRLTQTKSCKEDGKL